MLSLKIKLSGDIKAQAIDTDFIADRATAIILNRIRTRFRRMEGPDGKRWLESKAASIRKAGGYTWSNGRKVTGGQTLFATGSLFHGIQAYKKRSGERGIGVLDRIKYAGFLQYGTKKMPARPFLGVNDGDASLIEQQLKSIGKRIFRRA